MEEAKRRARDDFLFVGITEEAEATEALFRAMFTGNLNTEVAFSSTHHRKNKQSTDDRQHQMESSLRSINWKDDFDQPLYEEVKRVFYARCKAYNITTTQQQRENVLLNV